MLNMSQNTLIVTHTTHTHPDALLFASTALLSQPGHIYPATCSLFHWPIKHSSFSAVIRHQCVQHLTLQTKASVFNHKDTIQLKKYKDCREYIMYLSVIRHRK